MSTVGDAPLSLVLPDAGDTVSLGVLNSNYVAINVFAAAKDAALAAISSAGWVSTDRLADGAVSNVKVASGLDGSKVTSGAVYDSTRWGGRKVFVASSAPSSGVVDGDVWIQV